MPTKGNMQLVNVCLQIEDKFLVCVGALFYSNEIYYLKDDAIGKIDDISFLEYIDKIAGVKKLTTNPAGKEQKSQSDIPLDVIFEEYKNTKSIKKTAKIAGLSEEKTKKILIANGLYTSEKHEKIKDLLNQGKTFDEIAEKLKMSKKQLRVFIPQ